MTELAVHHLAAPLPSRFDREGHPGIVLCSGFAAIVPGNHSPERAHASDGGGESAAFRRSTNRVWADFLARMVRDGRS
ncbi:MAG: hypothetical protein LC104_01430, partial [Bacteroidales bacterium]|nr:hypothetical protein [Bacteroidales bacterium]